MGATLTSPDDHRSAAQLWAALSDHFFGNESGELEYQEFLELAETCGLLTLTPYDPTQHADVAHADDVERGDPIYVPTDVATRLHALAKESP